MKNIKILLILAVVSVMLGSCVKEEFPENGIVTQDQVAEALEASTAGLHAWMNKFNVIGNGNHWDFGYGALMMQRELLGQDMIQDPNYDNWGSWRQALNLGPEYTIGAFPWRWYYRLILLSNAIIALVPNYEEASDPERWSVGIAYTYRSMAYFDLARLYLAGRYIGNEEGITIPIITEETSAEASRNNPRAKASDVYSLILGDLEKAAICLEDYNRSDMIMPNAAVINGMYARVYLEMGNWTEAKNHAAKARTGYSPLTAAQWRNRQTGFNDPNNPSWMWCFTNTNNDEVVKESIICWAANMTNEQWWGYSGPGGGNYIRIDAHLYSLVGDTDFRKNSWIDPRGTIPIDSGFYTADDNVYGDYDLVSLKFRPGSGQTEDYISGNSVSIPLMRMEEMMLIEAEAAGRLNVADGVALLNTFAQTRDASYSSTATTVEQFIEDVWLQRRIELWGEGISLFDLKRLNKPVIRSYAGSNHLELARYNTTEQPDWLNFVIPRTEINANDGISQEQNNPTPVPPTAPSPEHVW